MPGGLEATKGRNYALHVNQESGMLRGKKVKLINEIDNRYGRLVVMKKNGNDNSGGALWKCKCDCGNTITTRGSALRNGTTKSCGCYQKETASKNFIKHGYYKERIYDIWRGMKRRCLNKKALAYKYYGERRIRICAEWIKFLPFYEWAIQSGYTNKLTIERINNNGNYNPDNCMWATRQE